MAKHVENLGHRCLEAWHYWLLALLLAGCIASWALWYAVKQQQHTRRMAAEANVDRHLAERWTQLSR